MSSNAGGALIPAEVGHVHPPALLRAVLRCVLAVVLLISLMLFMVALSSAAETLDSGRIGFSVGRSGICGGST